MPMEDFFGDLIDRDRLAGRKARLFDCTTFGQIPDIAD